MKLVVEKFIWGLKTASMSYFYTIFLRSRLEHLRSTYVKFFVEIIRPYG